MVLWILRPLFRTVLFAACLSPVCAGQETAASAKTPRLIRTDPGWPTVVELNVGDSYEVSRSVDGKTATRRIKVISVSHRWEPDYWIDENPGHKTLNAARVVIDVSCVETTLLHRPYQMPLTVNGLRVYVESTKRWAAHGRLAGMPEVDRDVRLSTVAEIVSYTWRLHDGTVVENAVARVTYEKPGLYSEQLVVRTDAGYDDRDFAQVRVFDPDRGRKIARGWAYYTPVRGIKPGTTVLFWNRLVGMAGPVTIDFGDGSPKQTIHREVEHAYAESGLYTVTLSGQGPDNEPATVRLRVVVE
jgi:hypothetical protein